MRRWISCCGVLEDCQIHFYMFAVQKMKDHIASDLVKGKLENIKRKVSLLACIRLLK